MLTFLKGILFLGNDEHFYTQNDITPLAANKAEWLHLGQTMPMQPPLHHEETLVTFKCQTMPEHHIPSNVFLGCFRPTGIFNGKLQYKSVGMPKSSFVTQFECIKTNTIV